MKSLRNQWVLTLVTFIVVSMVNGNEGGVMRHARLKRSASRQVHAACVSSVGA